MRKGKEACVTLKPACACCAAVWAPALREMVSVWTPTWTGWSQPEGGALCHHILPVSQVSSFPTRTRADQSCNSSGRHMLLTNLLGLVFLASSHTHPSQSGTASLSAWCQMQWPGFQTICLPAGRSVKKAAESQADPQGTNSLNSSLLWCGCHRWKSGLILPGFVEYLKNQVNYPARQISKIFNIEPNDLSTLIHTAAPPNVGNIRLWTVLWISVVPDLLFCPT